MDENQVTQLINKRLQTALSGFNSAPVAPHTHNGYDSQQLTPADSLYGFPVFQVTDASVAPTDKSNSGMFRFQVDNNNGTAHYYLWTYLVYVDQSNGSHTGTGKQVPAWIGISL